MVTKTLNVQLPAEVVAYYYQAAKLAGVRPETVMRVVLAIQTLAMRNSQQAFVTKTEWTVEKTP